MFTRLVATFQARPGFQELEGRVRKITCGSASLEERNNIPKLILELEDEIYRREISLRPLDKRGNLEELKKYRRQLCSEIVQEAHNTIVKRTASEIREKLEPKVTKYLDIARDDENLKYFWFHFSKEALDKGGILKEGAFKDLFEYARAWLYDMYAKNPAWDYDGKGALWGAIENYITPYEGQRLVKREIKSEDIRKAKAAIKELADFPNGFRGAKDILSRVGLDLNAHLGFDVNIAFLGLAWEMAGMKEDFWDRKAKHDNPELTPSEFYCFIRNAYKVSDYLLTDIDHRERIYNKRAKTMVQARLLSEYTFQHLYNS